MLVKYEYKLNIKKKNFRFLEMVDNIYTKANFDALYFENHTILSQYVNRNLV